MKMGYLLGAVIVASAGVALYSSTTRTSAPPAAEPPAPGAAALAQPPSAPAEPSRAGAVLEGQVLEILDVPGYTYLRVGAPGAEGEWAAVTTAQLKVGQQIRVRSDAVMSDFESTTLKRKFATIHFGSLEDGSSHAAAGAMPPGHPPTGGSAAAHPTTGGPPAGHAAGQAPAAAIEVGKVEKAPGANGRTVAELFAQRSALAAKKVRVRGVVVKASNGIMGKNFLHLRDGSGSEATKDHDLTVTTSEELQRGQTVLVEGTLVLDKDLGAGYRYEVMLEEAVSVR